MKKVNDVMIILKNYKKIVEITGGETELDDFIEMLTPYKTLSLESFHKKLVGDELNHKQSKVSPREQAIQIGALYYRLKTKGDLNKEEYNQLSTYLALSENKILNQVLEIPFDKTYQFINELSDKSLIINHLGFLGTALLNIRLKSGTKLVQKKNLLDVLWKVIENQKMNEIYESRL